MIKKDYGKKIARRKQSSAQKCSVGRAAQALARPLAGCRGLCLFPAHESLPIGRDFDLKCLANDIALGVVVDRGGMFVSGRLENLQYPGGVGLAGDDIVSNLTRIS
jgi:hypothetical protein